MNTMRKLTGVATVALLLGVACGKKEMPAAAAKGEQAAPAGPALIPAPQPVPDPEPASPTVPSSAWQPAPAQVVEAATKVEKLKAPKVAKLESDDPNGAWWKDTPYIDVAMMPQQMAMPFLEKATITNLRAQVAHDGEKLAVRVTWEDATPDGNVDTSRFADAVAIEFPLKGDSPATMGSKDSPVQIVQWKGIWQKDIDVGFQDVQDLHPNFWSDLYWFTEGGHPHKIPQAFKKKESLQWLVALSAGNPVALLQRSTPVAEYAAVGWGTLTHQHSSASTGRGLWHAGKWSVVFIRPLKTDDAQDAQLAAGQPTKLAFAVWDGGKGQVGGRKHWSGWNDVELAP